MTSNIGTCIVIAAAALLTGAGSVHGQQFPSKPIRQIVPYSPGGSLDIFARLIAQKLSESLGQNVIVENRPGANGTIGTAAVAKMPPDGYTIMATSTVHYMVPFFSKNVPYDPVKDFTPIFNGANVPSVLAVHPSTPFNTIDQLIDHAKKTRATLHYGTTGVGSTQHLAGVLLGQMAGIDLQHVAYKGGNPAVTDAISGTIPIAILTAPTIMPYARSGKLRALAVIEAQRSTSAPSVPAIGETVPGYAAPNLWFGILGPAGMPVSVLDRLNSEMRKALMAPDARARLESLGFDVTANTSSREFEASINTDVALIRRIVTTAGILPE